MEVLSPASWGCLDTVGSWHVEWWCSPVFAVKGACFFPLKVEAALTAVGRT